MASRGNVDDDYDNDEDDDEVVSPVIAAIRSDPQSRFYDPRYARPIARAGAPGHRLADRREGGATSTLPTSTIHAHRCGVPPRRAGGAMARLGCDTAQRPAHRTTTSRFR